MIALDTNVLVRYLVDDDPQQSRQAARLIERAVARDESLFISDMVFCETVWVLVSAYGLPRTEIADALGALLRARSLVFASTDRLASALEAYRRGKGDFADYLIREQAHAHGADAVATFDKALLKEPGFVAPR
jgi:predicted nucleic-acid-binding protein